MKFDSYHPTINFIFFTTVICFGFMFTQPVFLMIGYACAFIYSVYLGKKKALLLNVIVIVLVFSYAFYYASYNHFGVTNLAYNSIGNAITLESIYGGFVKGIHLATGIMWYYCVMKIVSSDKVIYLLGRISPKLSLFLSILLRFIPQIANRFRRAKEAQKAIGRDKGIRNVICILSIVITWTLEKFVESADSMKSRGYTLKGRTAYSLYRFDNRDRGVVILMFTCITGILMGIILEETKMLMNPQIIMKPITGMSCVFYGVYVFYCLLPMSLQMNCLKKMPQ